MDKTEKSNKLIAEFMGTTYKQKKNTHGVVLYKVSWDWFMPVVEKIEKMYETETSLPRFEINSHYVKFFIMDYNTGLSYVSISGCYLKSPEAIKFKTKIEAVYNEVVEFINWHNKIGNELS